MCPTTTPYSSVEPLEGSTSEQDLSRTPDGDRTEIGATISLTGGSTTEVFKNPFTLGVSFCWCNCNVDWHSAPNCPVRKSSWCGKHDCRASVPNRRRTIVCQTLSEMAVMFRTCFLVRRETAVVEPLCFPVVVPTRPQGGCDPVLPLPMGRGRDYPCA